MLWYIAINNPLIMSSEENFVNIKIFSQKALDYIIWIDYLKFNLYL